MKPAAKSRVKPESPAELSDLPSLLNPCEKMTVTSDAREYSGVGMQWCLGCQSFRPRESFRFRSECCDSCGRKPFNNQPAGNGAGKRGTPRG